MRTSNEILAEVVKLITDCKDQSLTLLAEANSGPLSIKVSTTLTNLANNISFIAGMGISSNSSLSGNLEPVTRFMGEDIKRPEVIKTEDLTPKELEIKLFLEKVEKLSDYIKETDATPASIIEAYSMDSDKLVIRGVAKKAGLENYKTGNIDEQFIADIRSAFLANDEEAAKVKAAQIKLSGEDENNEAAEEFK